MKIVAWVITVAMLVVAIGMFGTSVRPLNAMNGGRPIFDLLSQGYDFTTARSYVTALGPEGASFYTSVQHRWDAVLPILVGLTIGVWALLAGDRLARHGLGFGRVLQYATIVLGMLGAGLDLAENASVAAMLAQGPHGLDPDTVLQASTFTALKSVALGLAGFGLVLLGALSALAPRLTGRAA